MLLNRASVIEMGGRDVTAGFLEGAFAALELIKTQRLRVAILKEGSPSCGSSYTHDGTFSGATTDKPGVTAALLRSHGVMVFSEFQLAQADALLVRMEAQNTHPLDVLS